MKITGPCTGISVFLNCHRAYKTLLVPFVVHMGAKQFYIQNTNVRCSSSTETL